MFNIVPIILAPILSNLSFDSLTRPISDSFDPTTNIHPSVYVDIIPASVTMPIGGASINI
ncbi:hypothetical protein [Romboutsia sp.]|uniref:hypothetical protein n=1 Tax=Romboutsia sp. TaxID=1965302 RepID=UPI003F6787D5